MSGIFQLYRKAIAALVGGLIPLIVSFIPGAEALADPVTVNVLSVVLAAGFAALTADKIDGASVVDLARVVIDALDRVGSDGDPSPGTAATVVGRVDGTPVAIVATPIPPEVNVSDFAERGIGLKGGDA